MVDSQLSLDPQTHHQIAACVETLSVIQAAVTRGDVDQAIMLADLTLEQLRSLRREALMPTGPMMRGAMTGMVVSKSGIGQTLVGGVFGGLLGWFLGNSSRLETIEDIDYLIDNLDAIRTDLKADAQAADGEQAAAAATGTG